MHKRDLESATPRVDELPFDIYYVLYDADTEKCDELHNDLINNILCGKVLNNYEDIVDYLLSTYK